MVDYKNLYEIREINDLKEMLKFSAESFSSNVAFKYMENKKNISITYQEFKNDVDAFGTSLLELNLKGKRIAVVSENRYEWALTYLSVLNGIGTIVPIDKELPPEEIINLIKIGKVDAVVYSGKISDNLSKISLDNKYLINMDLDSNEGNNVYSLKQLIKLGSEKIENGNLEYENLKIDNKKVSIILFTSGTTGLSKGVMLTHENIVSNLMNMCKMIYLDQNDTFLSILPLHHTYEATCGFLCPIYKGAAVAYCEGLRYVAKNMKDFDVTITLGVPLIFESMYKKIWDKVREKGKEKQFKLAFNLNGLLKRFKIDLSKKIFAEIHNNLGGKMRLMISGAAGIDPSVSMGFRYLGFTFLQGYGLTECSPIVAVNRDCDFKDEAAGLPMPNMEVKIVDQNDEGIGEIVCKGSNVMQAYYENEEETNKILKDGWFYTGDLGIIDRDGFLIIKGRKKNIIITKNGKNVYPEELEYYLQKISCIIECVVTAVEDKDNIKICANIFPNFEKLESLNIKSKEDIESYLQKEISKVNKNLPIYKKVTKIKLKETEFDKTTTKKIKRY